MCFDMENTDAVETGFNVVMRDYFRVCMVSVPNIFQYKLNRCHGITVWGTGDCNF